MNEKDDDKMVIFKTKKGKEFVRGENYCLNYWNPKYISVQGDDKLWTLYDYNGCPLKRAQNVKHLYCDEKSYTVGLGDDKKHMSFRNTELYKHYVGWL